MSAVRLSLRRVVVLGGFLTLAACTALSGGEPPAKPGEQPPAKPPADVPPGVVPFGNPFKKLTAEEYRKKYPFESMAERLIYEKEAVKDLTKTAPLPIMTPDTAKRLEQDEKALDQRPRYEMRRKTLELVHSQEAENFIKRDGFGMSRMPMPSVMYLDLPPAPTTPLPGVKDEDGSDTTPTPLPATGNDPTKAEKRMLSLELLGTLHRGGMGDFINYGGLGYVKDREHVAGFQSHQFRRLPQPELYNPNRKETDKEKWAVTRLELVSLLKHKEPQVYVSKELPRMDDLKKTQTRTLSEFEAQALKTLREGQDLHTDATTNHIRMVGALRASKQCLECHEVRRGDLLGAFSYDIKRDPPVKARQ